MYRSSNHPCEGWVKYCSASMQAVVTAVGRCAQQPKCRERRVSVLVNQVHGEILEGERERKGNGIGTVMRGED